MANQRNPNRLVSCGRSSYVSKSGIEKLLREVRDGGVPEAFSRTPQHRARKDVVLQPTVYGKLVEPRELRNQDGTVCHVGIQNPLAMLAYCAEHSEDYAKLLRATFSAAPSAPRRPWHIILYQDGVDPSDGLSNNHSRKSFVFYWSFLEFGMQALACEQVWFSITVLRDTQVEKLEGGIPQLTAEVLYSFFDAERHDISIAGVSLKLHGDGKRIHIWAKFGILLGDEPALKEVLGCKGHAGVNICCLCLNCVAQKHPGAYTMLHEVST